MRGLWEERGWSQRGYSQQTVDQEEAEVELDFVFRRDGLHGEVAVSAHGHKVVLFGFQVRVDNHAITTDRLATEVHHIH